MLTTKEIRDKAERSYKDFLLSVLRREVFFPFHIKGNKGNANLPLQELYPALKHLIDNSKEKIGYGFTLTYKEVNTRHSGIMTMPDEIFFENPQDFLKFIERENDFLAFRKALDNTKRHVPTLLTWVEENVLKFQKNAAIWEDILKIVLYFQQNNQPNCYWRQLPIEVDLAEMEAHHTLIGELLNVVLPPSAIVQTEQQFEPRFGLRYDEPMICFRIVGATLAVAQHTIVQSHQGQPQGLPLQVFLKNEIQDDIFLITDKNVFLSFPEISNTMVIFWEHSVDILLKMKNLYKNKTYYIADITPKSFVLLSEMRANYPTLSTFLMDKTTFDAFPNQQQTQKTINLPAFLPHLTPDEQIFYQYLLNVEGKNTLLQNDIAHSFLEKQVILL